jgi:hypothetical protein
MLPLLRIVTVQGETSMWQNSRKHLEDAGESYWEHFRFALVVGALALGAGVACVIHAIVPAFCQRTCSRTIADLDVLFRVRDSRAHIQQRASGILTFVMLLTLATLVTIMPLAAGAPVGPSLTIGFLAFCLPATFLLTNRELEQLPDD